MGLALTVPRLENRCRFPLFNRKKPSPYYYYDPLEFGPRLIKSGSFVNGPPVFEHAYQVFLKFTKAIPAEPP